MLAALALRPAAHCPPGFSSLVQTHRCPSQWHCSCPGKAAPSPDRHQHRRQPSERLQRETFQQDHQTLGKLRSPVRCVIRAADEDVLTEGEDTWRPGRGQGIREALGTGPAGPDPRPTCRIAILGRPRRCYGVCCLARAPSTGNIISGHLFFKQNVLILLKKLHLNACCP